MRLGRVVAILTTVAALAILVFAVFSAYSLALPDHTSVGQLPRDLPGENIDFVGAQGVTLRGWFVRSEEHRAAILLLHGVRANRLQMLGRARFLHQAGYSALLYDSRAQGESGGENITFGYEESRDAQAAVALLRKLAPDQPVGVIGMSLGGAAAVLAKPPLAVNAMVLESVYPSIDQAISDRFKLRFGAPGALMTPLLVAMFRPRLGFSASELRPINAVGNLTMPKMFLFGSADRQTTPEESRELYRRAAEPKQFWEVPGARHEDLQAFAGAEYERKILGFFSSSLE